MKVSVPYLVAKKNRDGSMRYYWQPSKKLAAAGWETLALPPDLALATQRAEAENERLRAWYTAGKPRRAGAAPDVADDGSVPKGSVWQLIHTYRNPPTTKLAEDPEKKPGERGVFAYDYAGLEAKTKRSYDSALDYIGKWIGPLPVRKVTEAVVLERLKILAAQRHEKGPYKGHRKVATAMLIGRVGRLLFSASRTLFERSHPCYVGKADNPWSELGVRDHRIALPVLWTAEGRDLLIEAALKLEWRSVAVAIIVNWWLGQREADILDLGHNFNAGEVLQIIQSKTAGSVHLPVNMLSEISEAIDALRADQRQRGLAGTKLLLDERNGLVWDEHRFRKAFQTVRECAVQDALWSIRNRLPGWEGRDQAWVDRHLGELTFMRLRHTVVTMLFRAGCDVPEIVSITGHTLASANQIIERYGVRDAITAGNAFRKRLNRESN